MASLWFFAGCAVGIVCTAAFFYLVQRQATSLYMSAKGARGQAAKQEKDSELLAMLGETASKIKAAKDAGEDLKQAIPKILIEVGAAHPIGVLRFGGELKKIFSQSGGLEGLEGLRG